jgi:hypothetical protein
MLYAGGEAESRRSHNPKIAGSNPTPATESLPWEISDREYDERTIWWKDDEDEYASTGRPTWNVDWPN